MADLNPAIMQQMAQGQGVPPAIAELMKQAKGKKKNPATPAATLYPNMNQPLGPQ